MSDLNGLLVVLMIIAIGSIFGIGWQLGREITKMVLNHLRKPVTVTFKHLDGSTSTIKLTHEETDGYKKVAEVLKKED